MKHALKTTLVCLVTVALCTMGIVPEAFADETVDADANQALETSTEDADSAAVQDAENETQAAEQDEMLEELLAALDEEEAASQSVESADEQAEEDPYEVVDTSVPEPSGYDKMDFYAEASDEDGQVRTLAEPTVTPMYLSDEMKYFAKYESNQNYDQGLSYFDGYHAVGYYQFDNRYDLLEFLIACYNYNPKTYSMFKSYTTMTESKFKAWNAMYDGGLTSVGATLNASWHAAYKANPKEFAALQDGWAYKNYYIIAEAHMTSIGVPIKNRADCVKGLCWGMCNLFGSGGWRQFVGGYYYGNNPGAGLKKSMSDRQFVTVLCNYVVNNVAYFYPSQPQYHQGWQNRYRNELKDCENYLGTIEVVNGHIMLKEGGSYVKNAWGFADGYWYRFDANGYALTSCWWKSGSTWYRFDANGKMYANSWAKVNGSWYYFKSSGAMVTGWCKVNGSWYYMNASGRMLTGWQTITYNGVDQRFYFSASGKMLTGWQTIDDGAQFYFDSAGIMLKGWQKLDKGDVKGKWYFLDPDSGVMLTGFQKLLYKGATRTFYFDSAGAMATEWKKLSGSWYYFNSAGIMQTGLQKITSGSSFRYYYFNDAGRMLTGWRQIESNGVVKRYYFNANGAAAIGWKSLDGTWYYFNTEGVMQTGWQKVGSGTSAKWYFFDTEGKMLTGFQKIIYGGVAKTFYFNANGAMQTGWQKLALNGRTSWFRFASNGTMLTGWQTIAYNGKNEKFFFTPEGRMVTGVVTINDMKCTFDSNGVLKSQVAVAPKAA